MNNGGRFIPPKTTTEIERQEKISEAAQLMSRLALILEKTRSMDQYLYHLRRKRCMKIVWTRRNRNEDTILTEMLRWLRNKAARLGNKSANQQIDTSQDTDDATTTP